MSRDPRRDLRIFRPDAEPVEARVLLSTVSSTIHRILVSPPGAHPVRPNTPVLPFNATSAVATFVDPTARIGNGYRITIGQKSFIAPFSTLDATHGYVKVGTFSSVLDNATILGNPDRLPGAVGVQVGDNTVIGLNATVIGPARIGAYGATAAPTSVGTGATIDGATVSAGAIIGELARIGPGVTVPANVRVLPGVDVTSNAELSNPAFAVPVVAADTTAVRTLITNNSLLAVGFNTLYQGSAATGGNILSPQTSAAGTNSNNINFGNLAAITGTSNEPGTTNGTTFESSGRGPRFLTSPGQFQAGNFPHYPARVTGAVNFLSKPAQVSSRLNRSDSIQGDSGQPVTIGPNAVIGRRVSINSLVGGAVAIGANFRIGDNSVVLGGGTGTLAIGNGVAIGSGTVVSNSSIGVGSTVGSNALVLNTNLPAGSLVADGTMYINGVLQSTTRG